MEIISEFIFELIFEGSVEISTNKKIKKWIRYPLFAVIAAFYLGLIGLFLVIGIGLFDENIFGAILMVAFAVFLLIMCVIAFRKLYLKKNKRG